MQWSSTQYSLFEADRNRPIHDLLARVPAHPVTTAADVGCGPGNSTQILLERFPHAAITAMDSSPQMIEAARQRLPGLRFDVADAATWQAPGPFDLILSNAVLQWVPDHAALLPALLGKLAPGGSLAVQIPDNVEEPTHVLMRKVAAQGPWAQRLAGAEAAWNNRHSPDWYYAALRQAGAKVDLWRTTYFHQLPGGAASVVEWVKGTALRPFLEPLDAAEQADFLRCYQEEIALAYPVQADGTVLLPFPRLFFIATTPAAFS